MYLTIPLEIYLKLNYFLKQFPTTEWSGPAWYKPHYRKGEKFPKGFTLVHFHPVDLGHGTATTIEAKDTAKILQKTWKDYPETEKCMMGIIHSHHNMGAFFSGTDKNCLKDNAPIQNFYCSTVVASKKEKFAFAISYQDQYGKTHLIESKSEDINMQMPNKSKEQDKWARIAKKIKDNKKATTVTNWYDKGGSLNQGNLFPIQNRPSQFGSYYTNNFSINAYDEYDTVITGQEKIIDKHRKDSMTADDPDSAYISSLYKSMNAGEIDQLLVEEELELMNLNPAIVIDEIGKEDKDESKASA